MREWHGRTHVVSVTEGGFEYQGRTFPSLTAIAVEITGAHWSGPRFFGLVRRKGVKNSEAEDDVPDCGASVHRAPAGQLGGEAGDADDVGRDAEAETRLEETADA